MKKDIKNADVVAHKFGLALIRVTTYRLEVASKKRRKRKKIVKRRKTKAMATKYKRARRGINLSSEEERDYESDTRDKTDPNKGNDYYLLQL